VGPRAGLYAVTRRNSHKPDWGSNPGRQVRILVTILTELPLKQK